MNTPFPDFSRFTMIGINTEQNLVNLLPVVQWGVREVRLLSSPFAKARGWGDGVLKVLEQRGILARELCFSAAQESIEGLSSWLASQDLPAPRLWNLGGGLKSQQIALWRFLENQVGDWAVYPGTEGKTILVEVTAQGIVERPPLPTNVCESNQPLRVAEVVRTFSRELVEPTTRERSPLDAHEQLPEHLRELEQFRSSQEYRRVWYRRILAQQPSEVVLPSSHTELRLLLETIAAGPFKSAIQEILLKHDRLGSPLDQVVNALFNAVLAPKTWNSIWRVPGISSRKNAFGADNLLWPKYFECLVQAVIAEQLPRSNQFSQEVLFNWRVARAGNLGIIEQEHDALLMARNGTLYSLDAKTASSEAKDLNSRILQFERTSGRLARFVVVIPLL